MDLDLERFVDIVLATPSACAGLRARLDGTDPEPDDRAGVMLIDDVRGELVSIFEGLADYWREYAVMRFEVIDGAPVWRLVDIDLAKVYGYPEVGFADVDLTRLLVSVTRHYDLGPGFFVPTVNDRVARELEPAATHVAPVEVAIDNAACN